VKTCWNHRGGTNHCVIENLPPPDSSQLSKCLVHLHLLLFTLKKQHNRTLTNRICFLVLNVFSGTLNPTHFTSPVHSVLRRSSSTCEKLNKNASICNPINVKKLSYAVPMHNEMAMTTAGLKSKLEVESQYCGCSILHTGSSYNSAVITHRHSIAERGGCFQRRLSVCLFVCQHDNFRKTKRRTKLDG